VIGHSAGGILAMDYAAAFPDRVDKLILLDTVPVAFQYLAAFQDNILDRLSLADRDRLTTLEEARSLRSPIGNKRLVLCLFKVWVF
jgi:pimeloyl-ACP methyl ester carboxylesterase